MSGHSKWATTKHKKAKVDSQRAVVFQKFSREIIVISDAYYRTALDNQAKAKSDFFTQRAALEQFVGHDVFVKFEDEIKARDIED